MHIGLLPPGRMVISGTTRGKFLRMSGRDALVELDDGRRVMWSEMTDVEILSDKEEVRENKLPKLLAELARLESFTRGKYAQLGIVAVTPCIEMPKLLHPPLIRGALGERPADAIVCRRCTTKLCVRADHIFWGTRSDCQRDMCLRGVARPCGKTVTAVDIEIHIAKLRTRISRISDVSDQL